MTFRATQYIRRKITKTSDIKMVKNVEWRIFNERLQNNGSLDSLCNVKLQARN